MVSVKIDELVQGMIIGKDIYKDNQLIINKNSVINENIIKKLKYFNITNILICDNIKHPKKNESIDDFKIKYDKCKEAVNKVLNDVVNGKYSEVEINNITNNIFKMYNDNTNSIILLKMLQKLKNNDVIFSHSLNVGIISMIIAKWCKKTEKEIKLILQCGLFHDIGKLLIPDKLLNKNNKLTTNEFAEVKSHTIEGYKLLKNINLNPEIANTALLHHERIDGSGYPLQLKDYQIDKISNISKIIAIADAFDAMTSKRDYREAFCPFNVFNKFEIEGVKIYDTYYVITFLKNIINMYINEEVLLSNGCVGKIIMINQSSLSRPIIQTNNDFIDLSEYNLDELKISMVM